jgi:hypothetical protein
MKNKIVVETEDIKFLGIKAGAFKEDDVVMTDSSWTRICRPPPGTEDSPSIILWERDNADDNTPTEEKIVSTSFSTFSL